MSAKKLSEVIMNMVLVLAGASLWLSAQNIAVGAVMGQGGDFMPKLCSSIWLLVSGLLLIFSLRAPDEKEKTNTAGIYRSKKNYIIFAVISIALPIGVNVLFANVFSLILPTGIL